MKANMVDALNKGLHEAMAADDRVVVLGEDVATTGGVFRVTAGLMERFGDVRFIQVADLGNRVPRDGDVGHPQVGLDQLLLQGHLGVGEQDRVLELVPVGRRELEDIFPVGFLPPEQALFVAIMSYNGGINFGLVGDYDAMHDLDDLADDFQESLAELAAAAGVSLTSERAPRGPARTGATA